MQVKIDSISNGYTLTYWLDSSKKGAKGSYVTEFTGAWESTIEKLRTLVDVKAEE